MENSNQHSLVQTADQNKNVTNDLAVERTELALERTQLAWIRTVLSLLAGGIGLDKGVEAMHKARIESGDALIQNAHFIGIVLSIAATLLMIIITWYYIHRSHALARMKGAKPIRFSPGAIISILVIILGMGISFLLLVS